MTSRNQENWNEIKAWVFIILGISGVVIGGASALGKITLPNLENIQSGVIACVGLSITIGGILLLNTENIKTTLQKLEGTKRELMELKKNLKDHNIRILATPRDTEEFNGFVGTFVAFNAPMHYETANTDGKGLDTHRNRYSSNDFKKAHYYYPMFAFDKDRSPFVISWAINIRKFFSDLKNNLGVTQQKKLIFYVPPKKGIPYIREADISFFKGKKATGEILIFFHHSNIYLTNNTPEYMLITNNSDVCSKFDNLIQEGNNILEPKTYDEFLEFLDEYIKEN